MKSLLGAHRLVVTCSALLLTGSISLSAADLVQAKDGSGVTGYRDTPKLPWCDYLVHDPDRPAPKRVDPGPAPVPADAVALFNGKDLTQWQESGWKVDDGCIVAAGGNLVTKESFELKRDGPKEISVRFERRGG